MVFDYHNRITTFPKEHKTVEHGTTNNSRKILKLLYTVYELQETDDLECGRLWRNGRVLVKGSLDATITPYA